MEKSKPNLQTDKPSKLMLVCLIVILTISLLVMILYSFQFSRWGHDGIHHIAALAELYRPFSQWQFDTALSPVLHHGNGVPTFIYYSQWLYLPPFLFSLLGFGLTPSFTLTFATLTVIAWVGCYKLFRCHTSVNVAGMCATMFVTCNYFLGDLFTRFAYGEFFAYALLPIGVYATHKAMLSSARLAALFPILMFSIIILTYPLVLMNSALLLIGYCLIILPGKENFFVFLYKGIVIAVTSICLTAFFWLPGLVESSYIIGGRALNFDYTETFWTIKNAIVELQDEHSLGPFLNIALLVVVAIHLFFLRHLHKATVLLICILFYIFITTKFSNFIWQAIPMLQANAVTTRFLIPMSLAACIYIAYVIDAWDKKRLTGAITISLCLIMIGQGSLLIYRYTGSLEKDPQTFAQIFPDDINTQLDYRLEFYRTLIEGPGVAEFMPNIDLPLPGPRVSNSDCQEKAQLPAQISDIQRQNIVIGYEVDQAGCFLQIPVFWNVRYRAIDDSGEQLITGYNDKGSLMIKTLKKSGVVAIRFADISYVRLAKYISLSTLILVSFAIVVLSFGRRTKANKT